MSGICSEHRGHDPSCARCTALPLGNITCYYCQQPIQAAPYHASRDQPDLFWHEACFSGRALQALFTELKALRLKTEVLEREVAVWHKSRDDWRAQAESWEQEAKRLVGYPERAVAQAVRETIHHLMRPYRVGSDEGPRICRCDSGIEWHNCDQRGIPEHTHSGQEVSVDTLVDEVLVRLAVDKEER